MRRLWLGGTVYSLDSASSVYSAIGCEDDRITYLGSGDDIDVTEWDEVTDLHGATVVPGFNDSHLHLIQYSLCKNDVNLSTSVDIEELKNKLRTALENRDAAHAGDILYGYGWNQEKMAEGRFITRTDLDEVSSQIPICAMRACIHVSVGNSALMEAIRQCDDIPADVLANVDFETGQMRESACTLYQKFVRELTRDDVRDLIIGTMHDMNAHGIVAIQSDDLCSLPDTSPAEVIDLLSEMSEAGELTVRIYEQARVGQKDFPYISTLHRRGCEETVANGKPSMFRIGTRKMLKDGSLGARTAEMLDSYADDPGNPGVANFSQEEVYEFVRETNKARMDVAVHAIGDKALTDVLDAVEKVLAEDPWPEHRHGIVHAQTTGPDLVRRMSELGMQAYIQPIFIDADMMIVEERLGAEHAKDCYIWKTLAEAGINTSGGSDCPVEPYDILENLQAAVTRENRGGDRCFLPEEALTIEEGLRLFTERAAWAAREEEYRGTLENGKLMDITVLGSDIMAACPREIRDVEIVETVVGGSTVYMKED